MNELDVVGFDALYDSMLKCKKGVLWKDSVAAFYLRSIERVEKLSQDLQNGTYKASFGHDDFVMAQMQLEAVFKTVQWKNFVEDFLLPLLSKKLL